MADSEFPHISINSLNGPTARARIGNTKKRASVLVRRVVGANLIRMGYSDKTSSL